MQQNITAAGKPVLNDNHLSRSRGMAALITMIVLWSLPLLFQHYLVKWYDPWTQNFYRYFIAFLGILPFAFWRIKSGMVKLSKHAVIGCIWVAVPNALYQVSQTASLAILHPGLVAVIGRLSVILTALLAIVLFADERWIGRNRLFQVGLVLGIAGAAGVIWFKPGGGNVSASVKGIQLALLSTIAWAFYGVLVKKFTASLGAIAGFAVISLFTSAFLLPLMFIFGDPSMPLQVGWRINSILVISALLCITMGHVLYYVAIKELGATVSQNMQQLCPLGAIALSILIFGEKVGLWQIVFALILMGGAFLTVNVRKG